MWGLQQQLASQRRHPRRRRLERVDRLDRERRRRGRHRRGLHPSRSGGEHVVAPRRRSPSPLAAGGRTITCPAGSHGYNAILSSCDPQDDNGHGTHTAGTIGADRQQRHRRGRRELDDADHGAEVSRCLGLRFGGRRDRGDRLRGAGEGGVRSRAAPPTCACCPTAGAAAAFSSALRAGDRGRGPGRHSVRRGGRETRHPTTMPRRSIRRTFPTPTSSPWRRPTRTTRWPSFSNYGATSVDLAAPGNNILSTMPGNRYGRDERNVDGDAARRRCGDAAALHLFPQYRAAESRHSQQCGRSAIVERRRRDAMGG